MWNNVDDAKSLLVEVLAGKGLQEDLDNTLTAV